MKNKNITLILILIAFLPFKVFTQVNSGLVAAYPFTGNAQDVSGNNLHGSVHGATLTTDRFGDSNSAYKFNGTTNYIDVTFDTLLNLTRDKSFSFWYRIDSGSVQPYSTFLYLKNASSIYYPTFHLFQAEESGYGARRYKIHFLFGKNTTNYELPTSELYTDYIGEWVNIIATYSQASGYMKIYFNGQISDSVYVGNVTSNGSTSNLQIGREAPHPDSSYTYFKGDMDDIRIYNRVLTNAEIDTLYKLSTIDSGLIAKYSFTGNAQDGSGHNLHGVVHGASLTTDRFGDSNSAYLLMEHLII